MSAYSILIMAKAPTAGQVKTRLCPPCTDRDCAEIANAALLDTMHAALATNLSVTLALDGEAGQWIPSGIEVIRQRGATFADRLDAAWQDFGCGGLQIGMDTPQVTPRLLLSAIDQLDRHRCALGLALDGGWWGLALRSPLKGAFDGVAMSTSTTGRHQIERLRQLDHDPVLLRAMRDIDYWADALLVAAHAPETATARVVADISARMASAGLADVR